MLDKIIGRDSRYRIEFDSMYSDYGGKCEDIFKDTEVAIYYSYIEREHGTRCVGFSVLENKDYKLLHLKDLYIKPEYRGLGLSNAILNIILEDHCGDCCYIVPKDDEKTKEFFKHQFEKRRYSYKPVVDVVSDENIDFFMVSPSFR